MPLINTFRKRIFSQLKRKLGDHRARNLAIKTARMRLKLKAKPSVSFVQATHVNGKGVYLHGNIVDLRSQISSIELLLSNDSVVVLDDSLERISIRTIFSAAARNSQNVPPGFIAWVDFEAHAEANALDSLKATALRLNLHNGKSVQYPVNSQDAINNPLGEVQSILKKIPAGAARKRSLFDSTYGPAIQGIWSLRDSNRPAVDRVSYNPHLASDEPEVTLIVPIYGRYDFIEHQISVFINDADMRHHEVIYVIDDPRLEAEIRQSCETLARIYDFAFSVLYLSRNMGYAGANNVGVAHASGSAILLMNSDVMPAQSGWLREMLDVVGENLDTSLTGTRLLYEDNTVQHEGMEFFASPFFEGLWTNIHPGKGMPEDLFSQQKAPVPCEAVTGACLLVSRKNYLAIGGLDEEYIIGDFEDSDLCMKARREGLAVQFIPGIALYHLERQSQSLLSADRWKEELTYFNCWQHHQRWNDSIETMKVTGTHG